MADDKTANEAKTQGRTGAFRRLLSWMRGAKRAEPQEPLPQLDSALDGAAAVAVTEACVADAAGLSTRYPAASSAQTFRRELAREGGHHPRGANLLGDPVTGIAAADARAALATASGLAMSGLRGTAFVSGANLAGVADQLQVASAKHLPLVLHVASRASGGAGSSLGSGHEGYHAVSDAGCLQLFAANAQEAVDLTLVARRVAEMALVPAVVAIDGEQTADSLQEVKLPSAQLVEAILGAPEDQIDSPTAAQKLLFGEQRRRLPRLYDLVRPAMVGAHLGADVRGLAAAGQRPYFLDHLGDLLDEALSDYGDLSGRHYGALCEHRLDDAQIVLVAEGAAVETAKAVCDTLRSERMLPVGVIGVRCLRPLPGGQLADLLAGKRSVWVLERLDTPASGEPPLTRELRGALARAQENAVQAGRHASYPKLNRSPRLSTAVYGLAGHPLRAGDLVKLIADDPSRALVYLGLDFAPASSSYPKRQGTIEQVKRGYPELGALGLRAAGRPVPLGPEDVAAAGLYRLAGQGGAGAANRAGEVLLRAAGGALRGRVDGGWEAWDAARCDRLVYRADGGLDDPGDDVLLDVALLAIDGRIPDDLDATASLRDGGALVVESASVGEELWKALPPAVQRGVRSRRISLHRLASDPDDAGRGERLAGALLAALIAQGKLAVKARKLVAAHGELLGELAEDHAGLTDDGEAHGAAFAAGLEGLEAVSGDWPARASGAADPAVPELVRRFSGQHESSPDGLPAFWNQVGVLYQTGERDQLYPEPRLAAGLLPPLTSTFNSYAGGGRRMLPAFDPQPCTGCGKCWTACPEGAIGPVAHTPKGLLEAGMALAAEGGVDAAPLKMMLSKLGPKAASGLTKADPPPRTAGELLRGAPAEMLHKAPLPDDRKQGILKAFDAVVDCLDALPIARTAPLFDAPEAAVAGDGALLSLAINPDACKACGLCVALCEPGALAEGPSDAGAEAAARTGWRGWERLPDTPGAVIARGREHEALGELGALLLSRHCLLAMAAGDAAEPGSGTKVALRLTLAVCEYQLQRQLQAHLDGLQQLRDEVAAKVRENLSDALPASDISMLAEGIEAMGQSHAKLTELTARVDDVMESGKVDVNRLKELVAAGKELADLHWRISKGPHGLGRSRLGLAFAPDTLSHGIGCFPYNPFSMPVAIDASGETAAFARGLLEGQLRDATTEHRAMRRARLALANPTEATLAAAELKRLAFRDLDGDERRACPPLLLVGGSAAFSDQTLAPLLSSRLPVKVVLLADGGVASDGEPGDRDALSLLALGGSGTFVGQSSIAHPRHLVDVLTRAMAHDGPALVQLHAPSPGEHGFARDATLDRAEAAVAARLFPLLTLDPGAEGVFGTRLDISANPDAEASPTVADWAAGERRFAAEHLMPLAEGAPEPMALAELLGLDPRQRAGKTPYVDQEGQKLVPSPALVALSDRRARAWATLQELAGRVTPFTAQVRAEAEAEVTASHAQELAALEREYEARIAAVKQEQAAEMTRRVRERLMQLAGYQGSGAGSRGTETPA